MTVDRVGRLYWWPYDNIADAICDDLQALGGEVALVERHEPIASVANVIFNIASYGARPRGKGAPR